MSKYLELPWSVDDTIENLKELKEGLQERCIIQNLHGRGEKDAEEVAFDFDRAIKALEEVQKYRDIGTVMEIKMKIEELERWHSYRLSPNVKNPFAKMSTSICHNCDHKDEYIEELEAEIEEYRKIGAVEECRAAVEKQKPKKVIKWGDGTEHCPTCDCDNSCIGYRVCIDCGQKLDWSDGE